MRLLNLIVIVALVVAAGYVYRVKFDSAQQAERVAKLRSEIRQTRDSIAALRAEWARLDSPDRIELLAKRHLPLRPEEATQFDSPDHLPERPPAPASPDTGDPIGAMIENLDDLDTLTGTISVPPPRPSSEAEPAPGASAAEDR